MSNPYQFKDDNHRRWMLFNGRPMGAVVLTHIRAYVFPLYTPAGVSVLQECPPDHPHHQGLMVGQDFVNGHNFWAAMMIGRPLNAQTLEFGQTMESVADADGITTRMKLQWVTTGGETVLDEVRTYRFSRVAQANLVDVSTEWTASYGDIFCGQTKEGGVGMRVSEMLETPWGGRIRSSRGDIGADKVFDNLADWIEVSGQVGGMPVGIAMMPHGTMKPLPWFTRDYGIHLYTPFRGTPGKIAFGERFSMRVGFAAFDGKSDGTQTDRAWKVYKEQFK